jgi:hypothetical protein
MTILALALALAYALALGWLLRKMKTTPALRSDRSDRVTIFGDNR